MERRSLVLALALAPVAGLLSCASSSPSSGLARVDDLVGWIERVHVESELARQRSHEAIDALRAIVSPAFSGNAIASYTEFTQKLRASEDQASQLHASVTAMKSAAEPVFERWSGDLLAFTNAQLRQRSQQRLEETRARYRNILATIEPALISYETFNIGLRDVSLFLGNDFNAAAIADIADDVRTLTASVGELDGRFDKSLEAARAYLATAALPEMATPQAAPAPGSR
jgi:hypothetical protein